MHTERAERTQLGLVGHDIGRNGIGRKARCRKRSESVTVGVPRSRSLRNPLLSLLGFVIAFQACVGNAVQADPPLDAAQKQELSNEEVVSAIRESIVAIHSRDRDGDETGLGTGFVIDAKGLIATNFHVIGEGKPLRVELRSGESLAVVSIEATSIDDDLAIIRVDPGIHNLVPLELSKEPMIAQGTPVLAFGNPLGLKDSVVQGVVSAIRKIEGREMIQLAIPIEAGNSGGPVVDLEKNVHGIVSLKAILKERVGFAVPVARLEALQGSLNPIAIDRWVYLAKLDPKRWKAPNGGHWTERTGVIRVTGSGKGFGGRVLCLSQLEVPEDSFEVAVNVKLGDESGAAGLAFHADGGDRHYGFYPSNRKLRLTCFKGPDVMSWEIVKDVASKHYALNDWNELKVRVEGDQIRCFVNGVAVFTVEHQGLSKGQVGLASFRGTSAEFRRFRLAESLDDTPLSLAARQAIGELVDQRIDIDALDDDSITQLAASPEAATRELTRQADNLYRKAEGLKRIAQDVQLAPTLKQLSDWQASGDQGDLLRGSLLIGALAHPELDIDRYVERVEQMAEEVRHSLPEDASDDQKLQSINRYLFEENGFHGGQFDFYHQANNLLDRVIDDREGMPITLCVLYMELARRLDLTVEGVGLPGRFIVRYRSSRGESKLIDVFEKAEFLNDTEVAMMVMMNSQRLVTESDLKAQTPIEILTRILRNLLGSAEQARDIESMRRYSEGLVALHPENHEFRWARALMRYQTDRLGFAAQDLDWLLERESQEVDLDRVIEFRTQIGQALEDRTK
jgi:regulator of sirC expression with transglutaminase-like and TPR domain